MPLLRLEVIGPLHPAKGMARQVGQCWTENEFNKPFPPIYLDGLRYFLLLG